MLKKYLKILIIIFLSITSIAGCTFKKEEEAQPRLKQQQDTEEEKNNNVIGQLAPDFSIKDISGQSIKLSQLQGKPVFISFWRTDSPPCRQEMPDFQRLYEEQGNILHIITINIAEEQKTVERFMHMNDYQFDVGLDREATVAILYRVQFTPTSLILDDQGRIRDIKEGSMDWNALQQFVAKGR